MVKDDFRNFSKEYIKNFFLNNSFNERVINNFFKSFNTQHIDNLNQLKGIKQIKKISTLLKFNQLKLVESLKDERGNEKFIFQTFDGFLIESVLMPDKKNISICVSMQVGCKFNCLFCNTGKMGFKRNLTTHEILDQIRQINILRIIPKKLSCISFMGMGEPFDNIENCMNAVDWINSNYGYKIGREKITFSTSGTLPFEKFLTYDKLPNLAVSIHFANDEKRKRYMKSAKISLIKLKQYMMEYCKKTGKQISIEYCLIDRINDTDDDLNELIIFLKDLRSKVNLLNYNKTINSGFMPVDENRIIYFKNQLKNHRIPVIYRKSLGKSINAGCGQLGVKQCTQKD